jgi:4-amino-4-deoxy-L-arabinose transferase-like glycosyltransferase
VAATAVALIALALRLAVAAAVPPSTPVADMLEYWERAVYIADRWELYQNSWRMPGYPAALALTFAAGGGPSIAAVRAFNAVAGALAAMLTYWLARRTASRRASLAAALVVAVYPSFLIYTTFIATEAVVTVPLLGALIASTYRSRRAAVVAGFGTALTTLVRPAGVALLAAVVVALARGRRADDRRTSIIVAPALAAVVFVLALTPWWIHNARLSGTFIPLDTTGGINLAIGSGPLANGHWDWANVVRLHSEYLNNIDITTPAGSDASAALALRHVRDHPIDAIRLVPGKVAALFALEGREHAYLYSFGYFGQRDPRTVRQWGVAILAAFPLLVIAAVVGCIVKGGVAERVLVPSALFLAATTAMHMVSFGDPRFHLPFVPVLAVLATGGARWRDGVHRWRLALLALLVVWLAIAWAAQLDTYRAALIKLAAPGGSSLALSFDDLLQ